MGLLLRNLYHNDKLKKCRISSLFCSSIVKYLNIKYEPSISYTSFTKVAQEQEQRNACR